MILASIHIGSSMLMMTAWMLLAIGLLFLVMYTPFLQSKS